MQELLTFSVVALLLVMSPGPNGVLIVKTASVGGRAPAFANIAGLFSATFCHGAFSIFGLSALLLQSAELFLLIKLLGAAYLFYIGARAIFASFRAADVAARERLPASMKKPQARGLGGSFVEGFLTQLLNPKVSMFYLAAFPQFLDFSTPGYASAFVLVAIHAVLIALWFFGVTLAIDRIRARAGEGRAGRWVQRLSGSVMIYFSSLLLTHRA
ncbi:LysE family translocator [Neptuniibacter halophilus]|uniref:LysE family translocator n=1 Tax=Neptuniibacter halophilus TaxID=651666 RepID=UPI00257446EB|nr:LysE family translocator [Neptuniibacter halophilus]